MPGQWYLSQVSAGHAENSYIFANAIMLAFCACGLSVHIAPIEMEIATRVEQTICTVSLPSEIKVQVCPLVPADLWQIFASTTNHKFLIYWRRMIVSYARRRNEA